MKNIRYTNHSFVNLYIKYLNWWSNHDKWGLQNNQVNISLTHTPYLKHVSSAGLWCDDEVDISLVSQKWRIANIDQQPSIYQVESLLRTKALWNRGICPTTQMFNSRNFFRFFPEKNNSGGKHTQKHKSCRHRSTLAVIIINISPIFTRLLVLFNSQPTPEISVSSVAKHYVPQLSVYWLVSSR